MGKAVWIDDEFHYYPISNSVWNDLPGVYIFTRIRNKQWEALYVGKTESFKDRLTESHEEWDNALAHGMSHIHARVIPDSNERDRVEVKLIRIRKPLLNDQHVNRP